MSDPMDAVRARIAHNVHEFGFSVMGVFPTPDQPGVRTWFVYTIGLWEKLHHPELLMFGLPLMAAQGVFRTIRDRIVAGERFVDGQQVEGLVPVYTLAFRDAPNDDPEWPTAEASVYYGHCQYEVLQVVLPDPERHWPWEAECREEERINQQLLVREVQV